MKYAGVNLIDCSYEYEIEYIKKINKNHYDKIILFSQTESYLYFTKYLHLQIEVCKNKGINLDLILGCNPHTANEVRLFNLENVNITYWNTVLLLISYYNLSRKTVSLENIDYTHHYIFMNNKTRQHRCKTIDLLCKENLLNFGAVSWLIPPTNYKWECFHNQKMTLNTDKVTCYIDKNNLNQPLYDLPQQYYSSFCQLVCETHIDDPIFITEKTAIPLILGKPFIVISSLGYHKFLQELGFELYTEIFDYSFDNEPVAEKRIQGAVSNIKNICQIPLYELKSLYKKIHEKIEHNKNLVRKISFDKNRYPALVTEVIDHYFVTGEKVDHRLIDLHLGLQSLDYK